MIYASASSITNVSASSMWHILEEFVRRPVQGRYVNDCKIAEDYYDGFKRISSIAGESGVAERVFLLKEQYKIVMRLEDHPLCIGDTIFQIIYSDQDELSDRRSTLCAVLAWRMRPGVIEAPATMDKQLIIEDLLSSLAIGL